MPLAYLCQMIATAEKTLFEDQSETLQSIAHKIQNGKRITEEEGLELFEKGSLPFLGALANGVREKLHGHAVYFNRNFHIEPTNVCVFSCNFCSYSRLYAHREEGWELSIEDMLNIVKKYDNKPETEVHIVGGVHPKMNLYFSRIFLKQSKRTVQTFTLKPLLQWSWIICSARQN